MTDPAKVEKEVAEVVRLLRLRRQLTAVCEKAADLIEREHRGRVEAEATVAFEQRNLAHQSEAMGKLRAERDALRKAVKPFADLVLTTNGRIPTERLSFADWHSIAKAYASLAQVEEAALAAAGEPKA